MLKIYMNSKITYAIVVGLIIIATMVYAKPLTAAPDLSIYSAPAESIRIGNKYLSNNKTEQAIAEYSQGLSKLMGNVGENGTANMTVNDMAIQLESYLQRSAAYEQRGSMDDAIDDLSRIISLNPKYKDALEKRAALYRKEGNYQEALTDYQRNSIINPKSNSIAEIASIYFQQGDFGNSILEAQKALNLNNNNSEALLILANSMSAINNHTGALTLYKQYQGWAEASPQNSKQADNIANKIVETLLALNDTQNGTKQGEKLITQNKATIEVIQKLLGVYKDQNDSQNTTRMEKQLKKQQANLTPQEQYTMSVVAFRQKDYDESLRLVNLAIEQNKNIRAYRLLQIQSLIYMQRKGEACAAATQLCEDGYCPTITKLQSTSYCLQD